MAKNNYDDCLDIMVVGLTLAMESINVKRALTGEQINDLAEEVVDSAHDDNLSLEDFMMFLQRLVRGKYGEFYESMDIPKFMDKFNQYRQERHNALMEYRENKHLEYKAMGDATRSSNPESPLDVHLSEFTNKLATLKDELREAKRNQK